MKNTVQARVANLLRAHLLIGQKRFRSPQRLQEDCHLSSYDCLELALLLEIEFKFDLSDEEVATFQTFGNVVRCVKQRLAPFLGPQPGKRLTMPLKRNARTPEAQPWRHLAAA